MVHNSISGVAHFAAENEPACLQLIRRLLSYMPSNNAEDPPFVPTDDPADRMDAELDHIVPDNQANEAATTCGRSSASIVDRRRLPRGARALRGRTSSSASRAWAAGRSALSPSSRRCSPACSTSTLPAQGQPASCASATASTSRSSPSSTCRASCRASAQEHGGIIRQRGQAALCLLRGHRAQGNCVILAQGLRRAPIAMLMPAQAHRGATSSSPGRRPRLAVMGAGGRGQHHLPPRDRHRRGRRSGGRA
ncbi:MAG: hypothetical protein KatS3mg052_1772 [Candidatus Roseilinea sp.]|nr:MAG: hypothetical protein KatS3mg052_1772 [Candidatus Roseilinea sp.]